MLKLVDGWVKARDKRVWLGRLGGGKREGRGQVGREGWWVGTRGHPAGSDHYPHAGFSITKGSLDKIKTNFLFQYIPIYFCFQQHTIYNNIEMSCLVVDFNNVLKE